MQSEKSVVDVTTPVNLSFLFTQHLDAEMVALVVVFNNSDARFSKELVSTLELNILSVFHYVPLFRRLYNVELRIIDIDDAIAQLESD